MNKNESNMQDDKLKELLSGTKLKAGENLKYRIMQQIQTEQALQHKMQKTARPAVGNMLSIFGIMYALIALVGVGTYFMVGGENMLKSVAFFLPVILIASVCGVFWMITSYDDGRRSRQKAKE
jgi:predicted lipid-binding transport protein (Tim44 family)